MKRMLRNKASYVILEGFLTTLLERQIKIQKLLESEGNQESEEDKYNRVDILAEDEHGELFLIEVQNNNEYAYFQRMLFGTSKLITDYIERGQGYENVKKVYSINIVYFPLGVGDDYVYRGVTEFRGVKTGSILNLSPFQVKQFNAQTPTELYPEYYVLRVNDFNRLAVTPLEQWIYFLNTSKIPDTADAPGLSEARKQLVVDSMTKAERQAYYRHLDNVVILRDNIFSSREEGREEGRAEGLAEGRKRERMETARKMKAKGMDLEDIADVTGMSIDEISML